MNIAPAEPATENRWKSLFRLGLRVTVCLAFFLLGLLSYPVYQFISDTGPGRKLQTVETRDDKHTAKLYKKHNLADINFIVTVDGERVYKSSDYNGFYDGQYRETLLWDTTGTIVALELMGKRVFAYNADTKQAINGAELQQYKLFPLLSDVTYAELKGIDE